MERCRNPFVNQVFVVPCKGGCEMSELGDSRNPFVNQVFVVVRKRESGSKKGGLCVAIPS